MSAGFLFAVAFLVIGMTSIMLFAPWWNRRQGVDGKGNPLKGAPKQQ